MPSIFNVFARKNRVISLDWHYHFTLKERIKALFLQTLDILVGEVPIDTIIHRGPPFSFLSSYSDLIADIAAHIGLLDFLFPIPLLLKALTYKLTDKARSQTSSSLFFFLFIAIIWLCFGLPWVILQLAQSLLGIMLSALITLIGIPFLAVLPVKITQAECRTLESRNVREFIAIDILTPERALRLTRHERVQLGHIHSLFICLISNKVLEIERFFTLTLQEQEYLLNLDAPYIQALLDRTLTLEAAI